MPEPPLPAVEVRRGLIVPEVPDVGNQGLLFDRRPMMVGEFRFTGRSAEPVGRPTVNGFQEALALACEFYESSPYWIGALVAYGESREDWSEKLDQAMSVTKLARATLLNLGYLYRHSTEETRALAPTPGHLDVVAKLPVEEQREWLDKARREEMPIRDLRIKVKAATVRQVLDGQAETMHTVDVSVRLSLEAGSPHVAETQAWALVKRAIAGIPQSHVIAAHAQPHIGTRIRLVRKKRA